MAGAEAPGMADDDYFSGEYLRTSWRATSLSIVR
jgi:hypothetical protein